MSDLLTYQDPGFEGYRELVRSFADEKTSRKFQNSSARHAAVVLSNLLRTCKNVVIYDTHLEGDIAYKHVDFINCFNDFIGDESKKLTFILKKYPLNFDQRLLDQIRLEKTKGNIHCDLKVVVASNALIKNVKNTSKDDYNCDDVNFAIGDNRAYRLEKFTGVSNYRATCDFNDPVLAKRLAEIVSDAL